MTTPLQPVLQHPELEGGPFFWKGGRTGILLLHGMTATTAEVRPLASFLYQHGFSVAGPLLPGHGTTPADLSHTRWIDWAGSADDAYQYLSGVCEQVFVGGSSMGGLLALHLASEHADIRGLLLYAPALIVPGARYARWIAPFKAEIKKKSAGNTPGWKGYYVNPLRAVAQLHRLQKEIRGRLKRISQPAIILQGELDQTVDKRGAQIIYAELASSKKQLYWLKNSSHVILLDREFDRAAEITLQFIKMNLED